MVKENLTEVKERIRSACAASGRKEEEVTLIAVSKTKPVELLREAYDAGVRDFGENKVQEILEKVPQLPSDIRWHMIGHLQKNKVRQVIEMCIRDRYYVESVQNNDYSLILGMTAFYGTFLVFCNMIVDILYGIVDPRVRIGGK